MNKMVRNLTKADQFVSHYDPPESKKYKELIKSSILKKRRPEKLLDEPLVFSCRVYSLTPKSKIWGPNSKKKQVIFDDTKPDISNYVKGIEDALEGLVVRNDSCIVGYCNTWKLYTLKLPRVEIELWKAEDIWNKKL